LGLKRENEAAIKAAFPGAVVPDSACACATAEGEEVAVRDVFAAYTGAVENQTGVVAPASTSLWGTPESCPKVGAHPAIAVRSKKIGVKVRIGSNQVQIRFRLTCEPVALIAQNSLVAWF
jgi:hypothetical protein